MPGDREAVRERSDLVALVSERVALKRSGRALRGLCPFHEEDTPSFYVYPDDQTFHCFGCRKHGDVFTWVMETENLDFRGALELLAKRAGVTLPSGGGKATSQYQKQIRDAVMEAALTWFRNQLHESSSTLRYCRERGIDDETIDQWELGYAPDENEALAAHLRRLGYRLAVAAERSLLAGDEARGYNDFFRGRLIFPIRDHLGRLVAFGGRAIAGGEPKYLNSRDTPDFHKSSTLFGLHRAKQELREDGRIVLCEGYLDVIACHRAGIRTACAPLGTAFGLRHAALVKRWADEAVVLFDPDESGRKAALQAARLLEKEGLPVGIALLPVGMDPDDLLRTEGPARLVQAIESPLSPTRFLVAGLLRDWEIKEQTGPKEVPQGFWDELLRTLAQQGDPLESAQVLDELAGLLPVARSDRPTALRALNQQLERMRKRARPRKDAPPPPPSTQPPSRPNVRAPEGLLLRAALDDEVGRIVRDRLLEEGLLTSKDAIRLARALVTTGLKSRNSILANLEPDVKSELLSLEPPPDPFKGPPPLTEKIVLGAIALLEREREHRNRSA
ncbi:MAG: DNA primase [Armatimonadota bacterium]